VSMCAQVATGAQCDWTRHSVPMANVLLADPTRSAAVELQKGAVISRGVSSRTYFPPPEHLPPNTPPDSWVFGMTVRVRFKVAKLSQKCHLFNRNWTSELP
jgi:hypothetical protein